MTEICKTQQKLIRTYEKLDPVVKEIVQVAVVVGPMSSTDLVAFAAKVGVKHGNGKTVGGKADLTAITDTIKSGVLSYSSEEAKGNVEAAMLVADHVFRQAFRSGLAEHINKLIRGDLTDDRLLCLGSTKESICIRNMRLAFYQGIFKEWKILVSAFDFRPYLLDPFDLELFAELSAPFQKDFLVRAAEHLVNLADTRRSSFSASVHDLLRTLKEPSDATIIGSLAGLLFAQGNISELESLLERADAVVKSEIKGLISFLRGDYSAAEEHFQSADQQKRKQTRKRSTHLSPLPMVLYAILLLKENSDQSLKHAKQIIQTISNWDDFWGCTCVPLNRALRHLESPLGQRHHVLPTTENMTEFSALITCWIWSWFFVEQEPPLDIERCETLLSMQQECHLDWLAAEFAGIAAKISKTKAKTKKFTAISEDAHQQLGTVSLVDLIQPAPTWDTGLTALQNIGQHVTSAGSTLPVASERMIWEVKHDDNWIHPTPYIQKYNGKRWTKGRKVGLERLYNRWQTSEFDFLTDQDRKICRSLNAVMGESYYGYHETFFEWMPEGLVTALVGHPHLYLPNERDEPIELTQHQPYLVIEESKKGIRLAVQPELEFGQEGLLVTQESSHRFSIVLFSDKQKEVAQLVANMSMVPRNQQGRVFETAKALASIIDVQSDMDGVPVSGEEVAPSSQIVVQLVPYQDGLRAELFVRPLGEHGPMCRPGTGAKAMFANVQDQSLTTNRDLAAEKKNLQQLLNACESFESRTVIADQAEWLFAESDDALQAVVELKALSDEDKITLLWPRGKTHEIAGSSSATGFQVSVRRDRDWFAASGKLKIDQDLTVDLMKLLDLASASPSRFLRMDDGRFLALTRELRQRIADIAAFGTTMKGKVRFAPVRALVVDELFEDTNLKTDKHWKSHISRIEEAGEVSVDVPSTLQAELRDYQVEGYAWLKRLSHWNTGACLADDMGLGKTIQALALLIDRAVDGPQLVVAPASVGFNWESEINRFAPTLTPKQFRDCDRDQLFNNIEPGDVVIASYGLLQSEIDRFEAVQWQTVLLDEAQAIKNMATKRSQAVMQLEAQFKVILTGTPMENHLGEMWNLFRFVVPGLLGSQQDFRNRFAVPIERDNCRATRNRLKKLIQPFLLRRTKSQVLTELPPRSESILEVELSSTEAAFYEALRQKALQNIEEADETSDGQQHFQVLAELTKLRLACCHPKLVGGKGISSAKLDIFRQKIGEIMEGRHKVLVFSQFVKHLEILRDELDDMGVSYQYLDGSTSVKKRKQAVDAFQAGEGDVFLISLKAGGTGLNLTAADYVIHMDPWWNPAVEDQATDRAHRIGQQRPVNVYRMIARDTIEEKIVELHNTKRDLADSLLEGSDSGGKLTTEELIGLLKDQQLETIVG